MTAALAEPLSFLAGGGEIGASMRDLDWSRSPLGSPETWPQSLRSIVGLMLGSKFPMFVAWGAELGFLYNDAYAEILGAKHPAALGGRFHDIWAEIWQDISPLIDAALAGRASYHEDLPLLMNRRGHDEQTWFTFSYSPVRDEGGGVAGMFCACQETTGRVLAERQIAAEGRRFAELFDQAPAFMAVLRGPEHRFELANPPYRRLVGGREVVGRTVAEALPDAVGQGFLALLDEVYRTGRPYAATGARIVLQAAQESPADERFLDFVYQPVTDAEGTVSGILVQGVDVTAAHRAQDALRESEDHYRHAVELDPQTTWTSAPDGQLDHVNRRWFEWTGTTGLGSSYADGLHAEDRQRTFDVWGRSVATGEPYDIEHRVKMLDGSYRWMHSRAYPRRDEDGRIVKWYGTTEDIHDRKLAQKAQRASEAALRELNDTLEQRVRERTLELEEAHEALRQSQKMEAVGQLTGGIAHDFNNMLAVVVGSLDLLGRRIGSDDPRARRYLDAAVDGARRAANLTQRLLAFSRQQPLRPEPLDANKLVSGMSELLKHSLGPDIRLESRLAPGLWRVHADPNQLENAILNLAVNGRDAMPGGGELTVETRNAEFTDRQGRVGDHVLITVADTGAGMSEEVIAKAFDPFFTTKEVGKGTGLGLSQVYGFVKQTGGHVRIRSAPGRGTGVDVYLPRYQGTDAGETRDGAGEDLALGRREETVLVVEDEPGVRQFSADALAELGYKVLEADGAAAALCLIDAHPEIALMFTDVVMPEVNGAKLAEEVRRRRPGLPVLFTTGYARDAVVKDGVLEPGVELLAKPFVIDELAARVRHLLDAPAMADAG